MKRVVKCAGTCGRMVRPKRATAEEFPGTVKVSARGMCGACYMPLYRAGLLPGIERKKVPAVFVRYFPQGDSFGHELLRGDVVAQDDASWTVELRHGSGDRRRVLSREVWQPTVDDDALDEDGAEIVSLEAHTGIDAAAVEQAVQGARVKLSVREREDAVRILNESGLTDPEIAERLRMNIRIVQRIRERRGIPAVPGAGGRPMGIAS